MLQWIYQLLRGQPTNLAVAAIYLVLALPGLGNIAIALFASWRKRWAAYSALVPAALSAFTSAILIYPIPESQETDWLTLGIVICVFNIFLMAVGATLLVSQDPDLPPIKKTPARIVVLVAGAAAGCLLRILA